MLNGFTDPDKIVIRLTRRLKCFTYSTSTVSLFPHHSSHIGSNSWAKKTTTTGGSSSGGTEEKSVIGQIVWQQEGSDDATEDSRPSSRCFNGEIHLPKEMQPSCEFKLFNISVSVSFRKPFHFCLTDFFIVCGRITAVQSFDKQSFA